MSGNDLAAERSIHGSIQIQIESHFPLRKLSRKLEHRTPV
jgi:hypothetical protein